MKLFLFIVLLVIDYNLYFIKTRHLFDKAFIYFCFIAHGLLYVSLFYKPKPLQEYVDSMLYAAMILSPFLSMPRLLGLCIITLLFVKALHTALGYCLLTGKSWSPLAEALYFPLLLVQSFRLIWLT